MRLSDADASIAAVVDDETLRRQTHRQPAEDLEFARNAHAVAYRDRVETRNHAQVVAGAAGVALLPNEVRVLASDGLIDIVQDLVVAPVVVLPNPEPIGGCAVSGS